MGYYEFKKEDAYEFVRVSGIQSKQRGMNFSFCSARIAEAAKMETKGHFLLAWLPDSLNVSGPPVLFRGIWLRLPETLIISV